MVRYQYVPEFAVHAGLPADPIAASDTGVLAQDVQRVLPEAVQAAGDIVLPSGRRIDNFLVVNKVRNHHRHHNLLLHPPPPPLPLPILFFLLLFILFSSCPSSFLVLHFLLYTPPPFPPECSEVIYKGQKLTFAPFNVAELC